MFVGFICVEIVRELIQGGASFNNVDNSGKKPLGLYCNKSIDGKMKLDEKDFEMMSKAVKTEISKMIELYKVSHDKRPSPEALTVSATELSGSSQKQSSSRN